MTTGQSTRTAERHSAYHGRALIYKYRRPDEHALYILNEEARLSPNPRPVFSFPLLHPKYRGAKDVIHLFLV